MTFEEWWGTQATSERTMNEDIVHEAGSDFKTWCKSAWAACATSSGAVDWWVVLDVAGFRHRRDAENWAKCIPGAKTPPTTLRKVKIT